ncbi:MAG: amino acid adenylation domain-containing protein [Actinomycetota bacterium]
MTTVEPGEQPSDHHRQDLASLFADQVWRTPEAVAVRDGDETVTYRELHLRADRLARYLSSLGVVADSLVAVCLQRSIDLVASVLGVLSAGGAYVPLDPTYPVDRLEFMLGDSRPTVLVTTSSLRGLFTEFSGQVVCLDEVRLPDDSVDVPSLTATRDVDHLAYVIYTSGSTGRPKGVVVPQTGWGNYIASAKAAYRLREGERLLQFATFSWDTSAEEMFPCLCSGATLVLRTPDMLDSIPHFLDRCAEWQITCLILPTAFWHELVAQMHEDSLRLPDSVRLVAIGGERAVWESLVKWRECVPSGVQLFNTYGQTECTAVTACIELTPDLPQGTVPLGRAIPNVVCHILDESRVPVPEGVVGELYVGGPGVARGYLGLPDLTADKFVDDPFDGGGRLYRTGDLVRRWDDGNLEFVGRADLQVKLNGLLVEPGEIEDVLQRHPSVRASAVVGRPAGPTPKFLAAYVVLKNRATCSEAELRDWLRAHLPEFMLPASIAIVAGLPLTPNGKLDRNALVASASNPVDPISDEAGGSQEGFTSTESVLAAVWRDVLGRGAIGLDSDFFDMGGNSLLAMRVIARVRARFGVDLSVRAMFESSTLSTASEQIDRILRESTVRPVPSPVPAPGVGTSAVASLEQESLWFLDRLAPGNPTYNIVDALRLRGSLDIAALQRALDRLVDRHDSLRMSFVEHDARPVPVVASVLSIPIALVEAPGLAEPERVARVTDRAEAEVGRSFDLSLAPLLRVTIVRFDAHDHAAIFTIHHIVSDGWSIAVFFEELAEFYNAEVRGSPVQLADLPMQFSDYAAWQRSFLHGDRFDDHVAYWRRRLAGLVPLDVPTDRPRPDVRTFAGATLPIRLSSDLVARSEALCADTEVTLFMLLVTAFQLTLGRYTGKSDVAIGTVTANRQHEDSEGLVGFFVNALVVRTDLDGNPTFRELLRRVKECLLEDLAHRALPFEALVRAVDAVRSPNRNPIFDVLFLLQNVPAPTFEIDDVTTEFVPVESRTSDDDFRVDLSKTADGIEGFCSYNTALFDSSTIERLVANFEVLLDHAVAHPDDDIGSLPVLTETEARMVAIEWNATAQPASAVDTIPAMFEATVERWPERAIAVAGDHRMTAAELEAQANRLANHLLSRGVREGDVVGVCLGRSLDFLVAALGVMKVGAAYLPMDPAYPAERLAFMLADSGAVHLVTIGDHASVFADSAVAVSLLDIDAVPIAAASDERVKRTITGESACVVIYTSGTTGRPNGVIGVHRAAMNRFEWMWERYPFAAAEVCCQKTSTSFVDSVWETFGPVLQGVPLVIVPDGMLRDPRAFVALLAQHRVTRLVLVPSLLRMMLEAVVDLGARLPELTMWVSSGESLDQDLADEFSRRLPGRLLLNLYGSSEVAADSTFHELRAPGERVVIGRPIANTEVFVLDSERRLVPIGVAGEIHIGGVGLARGYIGNPELTAARFVAHPLRPGARLYRTGDLGRLLPDGNLDYLGRLDHQVKVGGVRIELGEVERALASSAGVRRAVVSLIDARLVAHVVLEPGHSFDQRTLVASMRSRLPKHMVPSAFVVLDEIPLTPNGKIDHRALPLPVATVEHDEHRHVAARDDLERRLVEVWQDVLGVSPIGVHDDFFELGGHSLLVVRLMSSLESALGTPLSLSMVFQTPTVAAMAEALRAGAAARASSSLVPVRTGGSHPPLFCVHADGGTFMYKQFAEHLSPQQPLYGFQARGLDGIETPFDSVEAMAANYLADARTVQPEGPYMIAAFSMGGVVMYEMARLSAAAGDPAPLVVFLDASTPTYFASGERSLGQKVKGLTRLGRGEVLSRVGRRLRQRTVRMRNDLAMSLSVRLGRPLSPSLRIHRVRQLNNRIADAYAPAKYAGPVTVLHATMQAPGSVADPTLGWAEHVTGAIDLHEIPGDHETIFREPNVGVMAETLQRCIDEWLASRG